MKDWSDLESSRVNHLKGHFTSGHGCDLKELIRVVESNE